MKTLGSQIQVHIWRQKNRVNSKSSQSIDTQVELIGSHVRKTETGMNAISGRLKTCPKSDDLLGYTDCETGLLCKEIDVQERTFGDKVSSLDESLWYFDYSILARVTPSLKQSQVLIPMREDTRLVYSSEAGATPLPSNHESG